MNIYGKPLKEMELSQVEAWVEEKKREDIRLEYKRSLPGEDDGTKKTSENASKKSAMHEFVKDVTAFANSLGGIIVYGVEEDKKERGVPSKIYGIGDVQKDELERKLVQTIRSHTSPSIGNLEFHFLPKDEPRVMILGIQRSPFGPHMAEMDEYRFWVRTVSGNSRMDVAEIRRAFLDSEEWGRKTERFRAERVTDVWYNGSIPSLVRQQGLFLHALPVGEREPLRDLRTANKALNVVAHMVNASPRATYHADGIRRWSGTGECSKYLQLFRNGGIEFFSQMDYLPLPTAGQSSVALDGADVWYKCALFLHGVSVFADICPLESPFQFLISVVGCQGWHVRVEGVYPSDHYTFDRDEVMLPPVLIDEFPINLEAIFGDAMNFFWQASGWPDSPFGKERVSQMVSALPSKEELVRCAL